MIYDTYDWQETQGKMLRAFRPVKSSKAIVWGSRKQLKINAICIQVAYGQVWAKFLSNFCSLLSHSTRFDKTVKYISVQQRLLNNDMGMVKREEEIKTFLKPSRNDKWCMSENGCFQEMHLFFQNPTCCDWRKHNTSQGCGPCGAEVRSFWCWFVCTKAASTMRRVPLLARCVLCLCLQECRGRRLPSVSSPPWPTTHTQINGRSSIHHHCSWTCRWCRARSPGTTSSLWSAPELLLPPSPTLPGWGPRTWRWTHTSVRSVCRNCRSFCWDK